MKSKKKSYRISASTVRKANRNMILHQPLEREAINYNGDINIKFSFRDKVYKSSLNNLEIKKAYSEALLIYGERV